MERMNKCRHELHNVVNNASDWQIYVVNAIFIFENFYPSSYFSFLRPHTSKQWLVYQ